MACGSCGGKKSGVAYQVTFTDGSKQKYPSLGEAQVAANQGRVEGAELPVVTAVPA